MLPMLFVAAGHTPSSYEGHGMAEHELRDAIRALTADSSIIRADVRDVRDRGIRTEGRLEAIENEIHRPGGLRNRMHDLENWRSEMKSALSEVGRRIDDGLAIKTVVRSDGHAEIVKWPMLKLIAGACLVTGTMVAGVILWALKIAGKL